MNFKVSFLFLLVLLLTSACSRNTLENISSNGTSVQQTIQKHLQLNQIVDDPAYYDSMFVQDEHFNLKVSDPLWLVPSLALPDGLKIQASNNNVSIVVYKQKLYVAFRTGPNHFASPETGVYVISTKNGETWEIESEMFFNSDVREPFLVNINDTLRFYFFKAGVKMTAFEPQFIGMTYTLGDKDWTSPINVLEEGEVHWAIKRRNGINYLSSYVGSHYNVFGQSKVKLNFKTSTDGVNWEHSNATAAVYTGGVSETDFELDNAGNLWAVGRLEDGDATGFGTQIFYANKDSLHHWTYLSKARKDAHMSPRLFRHNDDIYLISRKQLGRKPFGFAPSFLGMPLRRVLNWVRYSLTPKTSAIYKLNKATLQLEWVTDLPGAGDTALPSVHRLNQHQFLIANYSTNPKHKNSSWLRGQFGTTHIYLQVISFEPR